MKLKGNGDLHLSTTASVDAATAASSHSQISESGKIEASPENASAHWKSYWEQAAERLATAKPKVYEAFQEICNTMPRNGATLAADMMNVIKGHTETMEQRQSSLPFKVRGREIKIREQFNKIVKAVQVFKDFGSSLASLDPIHAGIPWAAVNLILQVSLMFILCFPLVLPF